MTTEHRGTGEAIKARREHHAMTRKELARRAEISRTTLIELEEERITPHPATVRKVLNALEEWEEETGASIVRNEPGAVTYRLTRAGVDVTLSGPVDSIPELEASVERLMRKLEDDTR